MREGKLVPEPARLWAGSREPIFNALPGTILANFLNPRSENALLWNRIYPRAQPSISLKQLLALTPLWGSASTGGKADEQLIPYYWGYDQQGSRLDGLDGTLDAIDGPGPKTEIDLFLLGTRTLIAVEVKHTSHFGRCSRFMGQHCPEVQDQKLDDQPCRYWEPGPGYFAHGLAFGPRPDSQSTELPCNTHYQLARSYVIGRAVAQQLGREFALWSILPEKRWRALGKTWIDFVNRVRDNQDWRRMRVISWEQIQRLPTR